MKVQEILATLKKLGKPQTAAIYKRHRSGDGALIAIADFKPTMRLQATEAAKRIGKVEVDHGATSCKTPDAVAYIAKASKRKTTRKTTRVP